MTHIEWTDRTWNPVVGCTPVSPGCLNCYAATMARRLEAMGKPGYEPLEYSRAEEKDRQRGLGNGADTDVEDYRPPVRIAEVRDHRAVFTGSVRLLEDRLTEPLRWRKPRRVFVCSMSDLFHPSVPDEFIDKVWAVMCFAPHHTFQVLTKRPDRMAEYVNDRNRVSRIAEAFMPMLRSGAITPRAMNRASAIIGECGFAAVDLPNVWLGTSVEDQQRADERIPHLLRCPAAVRFLSCEPLLGPIDLTRVRWDLVYGWPHPEWQNCLDTRVSELAKLAGIDKTNGIDWVIVGGESGPRARPCDIEWIRSIVAQCRAVGVATFVKQLGSVPSRGGFRWFTKSGGKSNDPAEWPEDLRVRQWPEVTT